MLQHMGGDDHVEGGVGKSGERRGGAINTVGMIESAQVTWTIAVEVPVKAGILAARPPEFRCRGGVISTADI
jgi:hypothetical protein